MVLAPSMTLCHEVCPMTTAALDQIREAVDRQGLGKQVTVSEVTVDPWRDSPARLRAYRAVDRGELPAADRNPGARSSGLWKFFGVYYARVPQGKPPDVDWLTGKPETFDVDHTDAMFLIDPAGQERILDEGMPDVGARCRRTFTSCSTTRASTTSPTRSSGGRRPKSSRTSTS